MGLLQANAMFPDQQRPSSAFRRRNRVIIFSLTFTTMLMPLLFVPPANCAEGASLSGSVTLFKHGGGEGEGSGDSYIDEQTGQVVEHSAPTLNEQTPKLDDGVYNKESKDNPKPPSWIEGKVFSNSELFMYSFWYMPPFKKEWKWEIPDNKSSVIHLRPSLTEHWKGHKPEGRCPVTCVPFGEKGRFKFHHSRPDGPHGFLEREGENSKGFPRYRFWFAEEP